MMYITVPVLAPEVQNIVFHRFNTGTLQMQILQIPCQEILNLLVR